MNSLWIILPAQTSENQYEEDKCEVYTLKLECSPLGEPCESYSSFERFRIQAKA